MNILPKLYLFCVQDRCQTLTAQFNRIMPFLLVFNQIAVHVYKCFAGENSQKEEPLYMHTDLDVGEYSNGMYDLQYELIIMLVIILMLFIFVTNTSFDHILLINAMFQDTKLALT